jgi:hypothetical protein
MTTTLAGWVDKPTVRKSRQHNLWYTYLPGINRRESLTWRDALRWVARYYSGARFA